VTRSRPIGGGPYRGRRGGLFVLAQKDGKDEEHSEAGGWRAPIGEVESRTAQLNGQYVNAVPSMQYNLLNGAKTLIKSSGIAGPGDSSSLTYKHAS
jgi:hypothetical protein